MNLKEALSKNDIVKYYVVSDSELDRLYKAIVLNVLEDIEKAEAACRARPVTKNNFADGTVFYEEIKR